MNCEKTSIAYGGIVHAPASRTNPYCKESDTRYKNIVKEHQLASASSAHSISDATSHSYSHISTNSSPSESFIFY